jgi:hypothetical protein
VPATSTHDLRLCEAVCRRFPGSKRAYDVLLEVVDADLLSEGMVWLANNPEAANTSYNFSNGEIFRW